jgi:formate-dependent nitrite reductase cytochrome c552 subunit
VTGAVYRLQAFGDQGGEAQSSLQCFACHSLKPPNLESASGQDLDQFHQGLQFAHGQLTCASCHNARDNYSTLKLADGRAIPFEESITLCAQCHGTQYRDYLHGAHGGMTGYWDLSRGERVRNHCQHCHDPHAPRYPTFQPAAPPQDKFKPVHALEGAHDVH